MMECPAFLNELLEISSRRLPDKVAVVVGEHRYTYAQIESLANAFAQTLQDRGVKRGDRIAIFLENGLEAVISVFGTLKAGAVFMLVNPLTKRDKLKYLLNDARASVFVSHSALDSIYSNAIADSPSLHTCIVVGHGADGSGTIAFPLEGGGSACLRVPGTIDQDLASIVYTSGSTGDPKGVMLTHHNMISAARSVSGYLELNEKDTIICVLPLAFDYGLYQLLMSVGVGATLVLERSFSFPIKVLEVMERERVTVFPGVPTVFSLLMSVRTLNSYDLSCLRKITNTAAALPEEHIFRLRNLFPQALLYSMYGLTECKRVTYLPPSELDVRPTSVGRGMPNEEVWLVDESGNRLPNGSTGELVIRGSNVMRGYWEKPEETAKRLKPGPLPGEMVLYSGDIFRTDSEGYLYFVARKDDIIKSRGEKVSPREVENVLYSIKGVLDAAVVGVEDELLGQAVKAFVILQEGVEMTERDVIKYCLANLESFMAPKYVSFVNELPKTDTGKIRKTGLA